MPLPGTHLRGRSRGARQSVGVQRSRRSQRCPAWRWPSRAGRRCVAAVPSAGPPAATEAPPCSAAGLRVTCVQRLPQRFAINTWSRGPCGVSCKGRGTERNEVKGATTGQSCCAAGLHPHSCVIQFGALCVQCTPQASVRSPQNFYAAQICPPCGSPVLYCKFASLFLQSRVKCIRPKSRL